MIMKNKKALLIILAAILGMIALVFLNLITPTNAVKNLETETHTSFISGMIVETTEFYFIFQNDIGSLYIVYLSQIPELSSEIYVVGDTVTIYFKGDILEISPSEFQDIIKITKEV